MFRGKQKFTRRRESTETLGYGYKGRPTEGHSVNDLISKKSLKDLPRSSYTFMADPYSAALPTSEPYPILNKFNSISGGRYAGERNLDGGNVQQYANSTLSTFLKAFDEMRLKINVNYRYLPIAPQKDSKYPGYQLIEEMRKALAESESILNSTTFTQLAINRFAVVTDLPMGSATKTNIAPEGKTEILAYTSTTDVLYAMSIYYQLFLQNGLGVMNWHNSFRLKQGVAIRNAWNREVPSLNSFFGLMNKKAFLSLLESINLSFEGEYIDRSFMEQMNTLSLIPSRRSDSITDPVLELQVGWNHPTVFKIYYLDDNGTIKGNDPLFDDSQLHYTIRVDGEDQVVSYWEACDALRDYLSLEATQAWARENFVPASISHTDNARYNQIKSYFDVLIASFSIFKPAWSDYRETLDVMSRTGTISWTKGFRPGIVKDTSVDLTWNVMVDHIYQMIFSGASKLDYDEATKRWRTFSLWNMYSGIPEYDVYSGGAFLSLSCKEFDPSTSTSEQFEYLPMVFEPYSATNTISCVALSRDGKQATISQYSSNIQDNLILNRLAPLASQSALSIRIPTIQFNQNSTLTPSHFSMLYKTLTQVFGMCRVQSATNGVYDIALDPDILAIYQVELNDITNEAITYARANAPFRGTTSNAGILGFAQH